MASKTMNNVIILSTRTYTKINGYNEQELKLELIQVAMHTKVQCKNLQTYFGCMEGKVMEQKGAAN